VGAPCTLLVHGFQARAGGAAVEAAAAEAWAVELPLALLQARPAALLAVADANGDRTRRLLAAAVGGPDPAGQGGEARRLVQLTTQFGAEELQLAQDFASLVDAQLVGSLFGMLKLPVSSLAQRPCPAPARFHSSARRRRHRGRPGAAQATAGHPARFLAGLGQLLATVARGESVIKR
jgi:hypothetical protein